MESLPSTTHDNNDTAQSSSEPILFKKRKINIPVRKIENIIYQQKEELQKDKEELQQKDQALTIADMLIVQKGRDKKHGIVPSSIDQNSNKTQVLQKQFIQQSELKDLSKVMNNYVETEMLKKKGIQINEEKNTTVSNATSNKSLFDKLVLPDFIQKKTNNNIEESSERWLAGIAEVQLDMDHKMKNIEMTENAKQERFSTYQPQLFQHLPMPQNYSTNFDLHKKERENKFAELRSQYK